MFARYRQALKVAQHIPDSLSDQLTAHEGLGDTYEIVGRYDEALESYAQARAVLEDGEHVRTASFPDVQRGRADLCRRTAHVYRRPESHAKANTTLPKHGWTKG